MSSLFRKQAVEKQQDKLWGEVLLIHPVSYTIICVAICLVVITVSVFLAWGKFARQETAVGFLQPDAGVLKVYSSQAGTVKQLLVEEGSVVKKGDPLVLLSTAKVMIGGEEANRLQIQQLEKQEELLKAQIRRLSPIYEDKKEELRLQIESIQLDLELLSQQITTAKQKLELQQQQLNVAQNLESQKHIARSRVDELEAIRLSLLADYQSLQRLYSQRQREVVHLNDKTASLELEFDERKDTLLSQALQLKGQITQVKANHEFALRAEQDGTISSLQVKAGQQINNQTPLLSLLPSGSILQGELLVSTNAIGFVQPGQRVSIQYSAFPFQKFGLYHGKITQISKNVLMPGEFKDTPMAINTPVYKVSIALDSQTVSAYGEEFPLKSGIQFTANIRLDERSLIEWLLEPLYSLKGRFS